MLSADDPFSDPDSRDNYPFRGKDVLSHLSRWKRNVDGDGVDNSTASPLEAPPSSDLDVAPVDMTKYIDKFRYFLHDRRLAVMHQDGNRLLLINTRYGGRHEIDRRALKHLCLGFDRIPASFLFRDELELAMTYVRCSVKLG